MDPVNNVSFRPNSHSSFFGTLEAETETVTNTDVLVEEVEDEEEEGVAENDAVDIDVDVSLLESSGVIVADEFKVFVNPTVAVAAKTKNGRTHWRRS